MSEFNPSLPFFAYGSLKSRGLAHQQIIEFVKSKTSATAPGFTLAVVDGIPRAIDKPNSLIHGELIELDPAAYPVITQFEQVPHIYQWKSVVLEGGVAANMLFSPRVPETRHETTDEWRVVDDPYFTHVLPWAHMKLEAIRKNKPDHHKTVEGQFAFIELQATFTTLWTLLERVCLFRFGPVPRDADNSLQYRIKQIENDKDWQAVFDSISITSNIAARPHSLPNLGSSAVHRHGILSKWNTLRNNIVHRGKTAAVEFNVLLVATDDLMRMMANYLSMKSEDILHIWDKNAITENFASVLDKKIIKP